MTRNRDSERHSTDQPATDHVEEVHYALRRLREIYAGWQRNGQSDTMPPLLEEVLRRFTGSKPGGRGI